MFTVHSRALVHFFEPKSPRPDDVLAVDFFDSATGWTHPGWDFPVDYVKDC
jgi:hypothetical protein